MLWITASLLKSIRTRDKSGKLILKRKNDIRLLNYYKNNKYKKKKTKIINNL